MIFVAVLLNLAKVSFNVIPLMFHSSNNEGKCSDNGEYAEIDFSFYHMQNLIIRHFYSCQVLGETPSFRVTAS